MAQYRYATENQNYEDYAAGRVLFNQPGATSFPVRLASEIFQHGDELAGKGGGYCVYDPCCGTGYLLTVLGFLHGERIGALYGADIDPAAVDFARRNLALLSPEGMAARIRQLEALRAQFGREAHAEALVSARRLAERTRPHITTGAFVGDATHAADDVALPPVDMLICDVPYGRLKHWQGDESIHALLAAQRPLLRPGAVVAITTPKGTPVQHAAYQRLRRFSIGKRQVSILQCVD